MERNWRLAGSGLFGASLELASAPSSSSAPMSSQHKLCRKCSCTSFVFLQLVRDRSWQCEPDNMSPLHNPQKHCKAIELCSTTNHSLCDCLSFRLVYQINWRLSVYTVVLTSYLTFILALCCHCINITKWSNGEKAPTIRCKIKSCLEKLQYTCNLGWWITVNNAATCLSSEILDPLTFVMAGEPAVEQTVVASDYRKYVDGFEFSLPVANTRLYFEAGTHQLLVYCSCIVHFRVKTLDNFQCYVHLSVISNTGPINTPVSFIFKPFKLSGSYHGHCLKKHWVYFRTGRQRNGKIEWEDRDETGWSKEDGKDQ